MVNVEAFDVLAHDLETSERPLTFEDIGNVFGQEFWMLLVTALMDAQDSALAIKGAINRLSEEG